MLEDGAIVADRVGGSRFDLESLVGDLHAAGQLDAAFLLTTAGEVLGSWTRNEVRHEVLGVMSATLMASIDTLMEELRGRRPDSAIVEAGDQRFLAVRTRDEHLLVIAAPTSVSPERLSAVSRALQARLPDGRERRRPKAHTVASRP
ncbi:MAG TPA: roadblock/LC7 domain-containing protein [Thermoplasmata archaeon]|nr:roadblock/LC7 domain-containing protein [Thermoplasmata archaeon]